MRLVIGKQAFAAGLFWQPCEPQQKIKVMQAVARQLQYHYVCWRPAQGLGSFSQRGFAARAPDLRWGLPSLAATLADQLAGTWLGAWSVGDKWFVISVRDDLIEAEGDRVFDDEQAARTHVEQEMLRGPYLKLYLPAPWNIALSEDINLNTLVSKPSARLAYVFFPRKMVLSITAGLSGILSIIVVLSWIHANQIKHALKLAQTTSSPIVPILDYPKKWQQAPKPDVWLQACQKSLATLPSSLLGWKTSAFGCNESQAWVEWARAEGRGETTSTMIITPQTTGAHSHFNLELLAARGDQHLTSRQANTQLIVNHNLPVTLNVLPPESAPSAEMEQRGLKPSWQRRSVTFRFPDLPWSYSDVLKTIAGLVLHRLEWVVGSKEWIVEGILYEQN